jgi:quercetin dioxygenase-like cupin family protein
MQITRAGAKPSAKGTTEWFTGVVRMDPLFNPYDAARVQGVSVTFEPAARTARHTHPLGQTLIVTARLGRVQRWGGSIEEIRPGDEVWFWREALAWRFADDRNDSYCDPGSRGWQGCRLARAGFGKTVRQGRR